MKLKHLQSFIHLLFVVSLMFMMPSVSLAESPVVAEDVSTMDMEDDLLWNLFNHSNYESGWGSIWHDGGSDCYRMTHSSGGLFSLFNLFGSHNSSHSIRIRDNSGTYSSLYSSPLNFHGVSSVKVDFSYTPESMEHGEDFMLEYSHDGGSTFEVIKSWVSGTHFSNDNVYNESVEFDRAFTNNSVFRFRCDASSNGDMVYIDDVSIYESSSAPTCDAAPRPEYNVNNSGWNISNQVTAQCGSSVVLNAAGGFDGWQFTWSGPRTNFEQGTWTSIDAITLHNVSAADAGAYTAHYTDTKGCTGSFQMHLNVEGCAPVCQEKTVNVNNSSGWALDVYDGGHHMMTLEHNKLWSFKLLLGKILTFKSHHNNWSRDYHVSEDCDQNYNVDPICYNKSVTFSNNGDCNTNIYDGNNTHLYTLNAHQSWTMTSAPNQTYAIRLADNSGWSTSYNVNNNCEQTYGFNPTCPVVNNRPEFRSIDGSNNNPLYPDWGKSNTGFLRKLPAQYGDGVGSLAGQNRRSAREISNRLSDEVEDARTQRQISGMAYGWGQFIDHDITDSESSIAGPAPISTPVWDPVFTENIPFRRSKVLEGTGVNGIAREQENKNTPFIDASQVYGPTLEHADWVRSKVGGKLKMSSGNLLPFNTITGEFDSDIDPHAPEMDDDKDRANNPKKTFVAGDHRVAEQPNLTAFHTIFKREHNRLCDEYASQYANLNDPAVDEEIYQRARKVVGALLQAVTYEQWLPTMGVNLREYKGYNPNIRPGIFATFSTAAYRWHTMVENDIILRDNNCHGIGPVELPLKSIFFNIDVMKKFGPGVLLRGLAFHPQYETDLKVNNGLRNFLFGQGMGVDLVSINIQRGRDHGLPDYNSIRAAFGLHKHYDIQSITSDLRLASDIREVYNNDVNNIDAWVGILAEDLPSNSSLTPTQAAIAKYQFEVLRDGDFYYYENDPYLTAQEKHEIKNTNLGQIIARNSSATFTDNVFIKELCVDGEPLEDTRDEGKVVCEGTAIKIYNNCYSTYGTTLTAGYHHNVSNIAKIDVEMEFAVEVTFSDGYVANYTDDTGCLPISEHGPVQRLKVTCLSNDPSTVDCTGFGGAIFVECFGSPLPISSGLFSQEEIDGATFVPLVEGAAPEVHDVAAVRVNNGFRVTLYSQDQYQGQSITFLGPSVQCLPDNWKGRVKSMAVSCVQEFPQTNTYDPYACGYGDFANDDFEAGMGNWTDGGSDVYRDYKSKYGRYFMRLRDNSGRYSSITTNNLNLSGVNQVTVEFDFFAYSMEHGEDLILEVSYDGGHSYHWVRNWASGTDFQNSKSYHEGPFTHASATISGNFGHDTRIRLRCDASSNGDYIFVDRVIIQGCSPAFIDNDAIDPTRLVGYYCQDLAVAGGIFDLDEEQAETSAKKDPGTSVGVGDYDRYRLSKMGVNDNEISKLDVFNGFAFTLFENDNFYGHSRTYTSSTSDLADFNNRASSLKVVCVRSLQGSIISQSELALKAEAKSRTTQLDITTKLSKVADTKVIERFNGAIGDFEVIAQIDAEDTGDRFTYVDENPRQGDNIYRVKVNYLDGTSEETDFRVVNINLVDTKVYPNPASDVINVDLSDFQGKNVEVSVLSLAGQQMDNVRINNVIDTEVRIDVTKYAAGNYLVKVNSEYGSLTKKFIKID